MKVFEIKMEVAVKETGQVVLNSTTWKESETQYSVDQVVRAFRKKHPYYRDHAIKKVSIKRVKSLPITHGWPTANTATAIVNEAKDWLNQPVTHWKAFKSFPKLKLKKPLKPIVIKMFKPMEGGK